MTGTALVLSPHLDDAAFSCGGTMALLADAGWRVCMVTAFTRSVLNPTGFALACQLDKGLPPEADYMAIRRAEDRVAAGLLGVGELRWLDLPEAPHRGYDSAPALFGPERAGDEIWRDLAAMIAELVRELAPGLILVPQGLGEHVDHRQMIRAVLHAVPDGPLVFYRDTPYAIRNPAALRNVTIPAMIESRVAVGGAMQRKVDAACAYGSQVGGPEAAGTALRRFAADEGDGEPAERFLGSIPLATKH